MKLQILHKTDNFIIVNKPPDLIINTDDPDRVSLQRQLAEKFPLLVNEKLHYGFYFPHRLDFATSGVMCIALNKRSCAAASLAFHNRAAHKYYLALVRGHVQQDYIVDVPVGEVMSQSSIMVEYGINCRQAVSKIVILERGSYCNLPATKVLILPLTGRRHQIRVHCRYIGHPIVGDFTYSNKKDVDPPRMFLHSFRLYMPNNIETIDVVSDDPFTQQLVQNWLPTEQVNIFDNKIMTAILKK